MFGKYLRNALAITAGGILSVSALGPNLFQSAHANAAGGNGSGCVAGCTLTDANQQWEMWSADPGQTNAYQKFKADVSSRSSGLSQRPSAIDSKVTRLVPGGVTLCEKSQAVWAITYQNAPYKGWFSNVGNATHGSHWPGDSAHGTIEAPKVVHGAAVDSKLVDAFKTWDATKNGDRIDSAPGYVIICSGVFDNGQTTAHPTLTSTVVTNQNNPTVVTTGGLTLDRTGVYSCNTQVDPEIKEADPTDATKWIDPIGKNNLHYQAGKVVETNFGKLYDQIVADNAAGKINWNDSAIKTYTTKVDAALAADKSMGCSSLNLDAQNKAGMAEGGVLNVTEQSNTAHINVSSGGTTTTTLNICTTSQTWNSTTNMYNAAVTVCHKQSTVTQGKNGTLLATVNPLVNNGFWQILSVNCNPTDFQNLMKAVPTAKIISQKSDAQNGTLSFVAYTKTYSTQPATLDFGDKFNPNPAIAKSGTVGFYDKECSVTCTNVKYPDTTKAIYKPTSTNVLGTVPTGGHVAGKTGAISGKTNGNNFTFFRDNQKNTITFDVWYPLATSNVLYAGKLPVSTTINRWNLGTPAVNAATGGSVQIKDLKGNDVFNTNNTTVNTQKNWSVAPVASSATSATYSGLFRAFTIQSTWASDANKPHVFNMDWEYQVPVNINTITNNIGFDSNNAGQASSATSSTVTLDARCYASFGTTTNRVPTTTLANNTGTGSTNNLDGNLVQGPTDTKPADDGFNLFVTFVRSTTE